MASGMIYITTKMCRVPLEPQANSQRRGDVQGRPSIAEEFLECLPCLGFARNVFGRRHELAPAQLEEFAVIGEVFFGDRVCPRVAALLRDVRVVTDTIEANLEVGAALVASF